MASRWRSAVYKLQFIFVFDFFTCAIKMYKYVFIDYFLVHHGSEETQHGLTFFPTTVAKNERTIKKFFFVVKMTQRNVSQRTKVDLKIISTRF